jgi:transposase
VKHTQKWGLERFFLHLDNARPHRSNVATQTATRLGLTILPHPPYSPDIAPSDFYLFGLLKGKLKGKDFESESQLVEAIKAEISAISKDTLILVFSEWISRLHRVVEISCEYVAK